MILTLGVSAIRPSATMQHVIFGFGFTEAFVLFYEFVMVMEEMFDSSSSHAMIQIDVH